MSERIYKCHIPFKTAMAILLFTITVGHCQETKPAPEQVKDSYIACGCGCCGGVTPVEKCLYRNKGDDLEKIEENDRELSKSPECPYVGCTMGTLYHYCD